MEWKEEFQMNIAPSLAIAIVAAILGGFIGVWGSSFLQNRERKQRQLAAGRALFNKSCANCHVLYGQGKTAGPDLTGSNRRNVDYLRVFVRALRKRIEVDPHNPQYIVTVPGVGYQLLSVD